MLKRLMPVVLLFITTAIIAQSKTTVDGHPAWIIKGNIYEVNVRQYTPEGTLNAFAKNLDRLKAMGVETLWFMPLNPISKVDRKGTLGSYYAVSSYTDVNPEFGNMSDWKRLVNLIHTKGMKVIIDWVPNHTGGDNKWLTSHPDFFVKDSSGKAAVPFGWSDTRQLDYSNMEMQDSMIAAMKYWLTTSNIDGFRCDVAWNLPAKFWSRCIDELRQIKNVFMLAEGDSSYLPKSGFDAVYPWRMFHKMVSIASGETNALALDSIHNEDETMYPANTIQMYFTSNHDENSWNKADYGTFPGAVHAPFAVFTQTMDKTVPLIYSGQEEPVLRGIQFFEKDPMGFKNYKRAAFYKTLLALRKANPALAFGTTFTKLKTGNDEAIYAYTRSSNNNMVVVLLNLTSKPQSFTLQDAQLKGMFTDVFKHTKQSLPANKNYSLPAWGYVVYAK